MKITKEQNRLRKNCILKAHYWFGSDVFEEVFKDYDFYVDEENTMFYVYRSEDDLKNVVGKKVMGYCANCYKPIHKILNGKYSYKCECGFKGEK